VYRSNSPDVAIVGGGIVGACIAEELARAGASVVVLDAGAEAGDATARAAGVAVPSLRYLDDPLMYDWLTRARTALLDDILRLRSATGPFSVALPIARLIAEADLRRVAAALGTTPDRDTAGDAADLAPGLRVPPAHRVLVSDGLMVDGSGYLAAVRAAAVAGGVDWRQGVRVVSVADGEVRTDGAAALRADRIVLACGAWTARLVGEDLPVYPLRGQLAVLDVEHPPRCIVSGRYYLAPHPSGGVVVGATEEDSGFAEHCTVAGVARLLTFAARTLPSLGSAPVRTLRAGLRPATRTGRPLVGALPSADRVFVACGHSGHGLLSARYTARGVAAALTSDDWSDVPLEFCPKRALQEAGK